MILYNDTHPYCHLRKRIDYFYEIAWRFKKGLKRIQNERKIKTYKLFLNVVILGRCLILIEKYIIVKYLDQNLITTYNNRPNLEL